MKYKLSVIIIIIIMFYYFGLVIAACGLTNVIKLINLFYYNFYLKCPIHLNYLILIIHLKKKILNNFSNYYYWNTEFRVMIQLYNFLYIVIKLYFSLYIYEFWNELQIVHVN